MDGNQQMATAASGKSFEARVTALVAEGASRFRQMEPKKKRWLAGLTTFLLACIVGVHGVTEAVDDIAEEVERVVDVGGRLQTAAALVGADAQLARDQGRGHAADRDLR